MADHVFVCYGRKNEDFVLKLATTLKERNVSIWVDQWDISPSEDWDRAIDKAIDDCSHFLIVLSPAAIKSKEVRGELRAALDANKPIVPVLYQPCRIPRQLRLIQYVDYTSKGSGEAVALKQLLSRFTGEPETTSPKPKPKPTASASRDTSAPAATSQPRLPAQEKDTVTKDEPITGPKTGTGVGYLMARVAGMLVGALVGASCSFLTLGGLVAGIGEGYFGFGQDPSGIGAIFVLVGWTIVVGLGLLIGGFGGWSIIRLIGKNRLGNR